MKGYIKSTEILFFKFTCFMKLMKNLTILSQCEKVGEKRNVVFLIQKIAVIRSICKNINARKSAY